MAADFGKQPGYGRTRWGNETDAWTQPPGSRISYPAPRNVHLGERFSGGWPPRRNFGILVGIRWPAADDGATILSEAWGNRPVGRRRRRRVPKQHGVEVRCVVRGYGVLRAVRTPRPVVSSDVGRADLSGVRRGSLRWFDPCSDKPARCIRLSQAPSGRSAGRPAAGVGEG